MYQNAGLTVTLFNRAAVLVAVFVIGCRSGLAADIPMPAPGDQTWTFTICIGEYSGYLGSCPSPPNVDQLFDCGYNGRDAAAAKVVCDEHKAFHPRLKRIGEPWSGNACGYSMSQVICSRTQPEFP